LRRYGERVLQRAGKKKALVAVARKLAVVLHRLWSSAEVYDPFYTARRKGKLPMEQVA
jgi:transposase